MKYLLDADVFIQAVNAHYQFNLCPGFWDWLDRENQRGQVHSVDRVYAELTAPVALTNWTSARQQNFFLAPDQPVTNAMPTVAQWAQSQPNYTAAARSEFLQAGDFYLIAHALAHGLTVVTHERSAPAAQKRIKIPDACAGVGVDCVDPYEMLVAEGARFVL